MLDPKIIALAGDTGAGKTTLALHLAHVIKGDGFYPVILQHGEGQEAHCTLTAINTICSFMPDDLKLVFLQDGVWTDTDLRRITLEYPYTYTVEVTSPASTLEGIPHRRQHEIAPDKFDNRAHMGPGSTFSSVAHNIWQKSKVQMG